MLVRPQPARGEKARDDAVEHFQRRFGVEIELQRRRHDAEQPAKLEDVPVLLPEDADIGAVEGIELARDQLDQRRLARPVGAEDRSEEHTSELQSLMRISYAVFCLKKKKTRFTTHSEMRHVNTPLYIQHKYTNIQLVDITSL